MPIIHMHKRSRKNALQMSEDQKLLDEFFSIKAELEIARNFFENVTDPDLITACVYEMSAIQKRYSHTLNKIRAQQISNLQIMK